MEELAVKQSLEVKKYPSLIKYMGSKSKIIDFVMDGINEAYRGGAICDLFSGSASLAGALRHQCDVHSNDIQKFSSILARTYNSSYIDKSTPTADEIYRKAESIFLANCTSLNLPISYKKDISIDEFNELEFLQKSLLDSSFDRDWHLFLKCYSGTWWSAEQCIWIDAFREVAEHYTESGCYNLILSSIMFAMSYTSQGTGHYAQYRDAKTLSSLKDILIYRRRSFTDYFIRKYNELLAYSPKTKPKNNHTATSLDFIECLDSFKGGLVYADPPYCFVHYSRFYHALETLVLYDYPSLQKINGTVVKGRYRENRHQSPFCIKTKVTAAFSNLFEGVRKSSSNLVMSYSNTGMISIDEIENLALSHFPNSKLELLTTNHQHMTLGRQKDRHRDVKECLLIVKS